MYYLFKTHYIACGSNAAVKKKTKGGECTDRSAQRVSV